MERRLLLSAAAASAVSPLVITSKNFAVFDVLTPGTFTVKTRGSGATPTISETGALPTGLTFTNNGDGTATISGTPAVRTGNVYSLTLTANNGTASFSQFFSLGVDPPPTIVSTTVDTKGDVFLTTSQALKPNTVNSGTVRVYTPGPDGILGTADDRIHPATVVYHRGSTQIVIHAHLPADTIYAVDVLGNLVTGVSGLKLDGEFNGSGVASGDGTPGGDYQFQTAPVATFSTVEGNIFVPLFPRQAPQTVKNFEFYANSGRWADTFFNRSVANFIVQGGRLNVNSKTDQIGTVPVRAGVVVPNEFNQSNLAGTIAMAKLPGMPNSATDEWFFNLVDNSSNLDSQNGGFTVFGGINFQDTTSVTTLNNIIGLRIADLSNGKANSPLTTVPVLTPAGTSVVDPLTGLVRTTITVQMQVQSVTNSFTAVLSKVSTTAIAVGVNSNNTATVTLQNMGLELSGNAQISLFASTTAGITSSSVKLNTITKSLTISPNQKLTLTVPLGDVSGLTAGSYFIVAQVTGLGTHAVVAASAAAVTVAAPFTDVTVGQPGDATGGFVNIPARVTAGHNATFSIEVINNGNDTAQGPLQIHLGDNLDGSMTILDQYPIVTENIDLAPGGHQIFNVTVAIPDTIATGNYHLVAMLTDPSLSTHDTGASDKTAVSSRLFELIHPA